MSTLPNENSERVKRRRRTYASVQICTELPRFFFTFGFRLWSNTVLVENKSEKFLVTFYIFESREYDAVDRDTYALN